MARRFPLSVLPHPGAAGRGAAVRAPQRSAPRARRPRRAADAAGRTDAAAGRAGVAVHRRGRAADRPAGAGRRGAGAGGARRLRGRRTRRRHDRPADGPVLRGLHRPRQLRAVADHRQFPDDDADAGVRGHQRPPADRCRAGRQLRDRPADDHRPALGRRPEGRRDGDRAVRAGVADRCCRDRRDAAHQPRLGILTRTAPQLNLLAVGFPVTLIVGLLVLLLGLRHQIPVFEGVLTRSVELFAR
ncbi:MAG: flagellar biosynthetic protein FliR [Betaproteobacteria bacterium]|nr:flagellar biosynthetic protein FliR [Betaproteobacteria bacterium]